MPKIVPVHQLEDYIGKDLGFSSWQLIDQDRINLFADATIDHQFIHVDQERAKDTPFGGTIAHGYLILSLLPYLVRENGVIPENMVMGLNYGLNKVRFLQPVKVNSEVRSHMVIREITEKDPGQFRIESDVTIEIKDEEKPALVAQMIALFMVKRD